MTFASVFTQVRESKRLSRDEVARNAKLHVTTVWKTETNKLLPRGKTMRKLCLVGLGLREGSQDWERLNSAWLSERTEADIAPSALVGQLAGLELNNSKEAQRFYADVRKLSADDFSHVARAISRPEVMAGIRLLNALYERK
jgi:transcriptional regulator with XRE-family HTH domain